MLTGLFFVDGAKLFDSRGPASINRLKFYRTGLLPSFGLVLPGLQSRLNVTGFNYFANSSKRVASGFFPIFSDRSVQFVPRGALTSISGDTTPVLILNLTSGDFVTNSCYDVQWRAENVADSTRVEKFPIVHIEIKEIV